MNSVRAMTAAFGMLVFGQILPSDGWAIFLKPLMEMSALAGLLAALFYLLKFELPALRKERESMRKEAAAAKEADKLERETMRKEFSGTLDRITDRWDRWEQIRHDDHETQMAADRERTEACTQTRLAMQSNGNK